MCRIEGCKAKAVAKGLCAKHYMRERRTGDPNGTGQPGRKVSPQRLRWEEARLEMRWSPRTFARFKQAKEMLQDAGCDMREIESCLEGATRPSGTLNVSRLQEVAFMEYAVRVWRLSQVEAELEWTLRKYGIPTSEH